MRGVTHTCFISDQNLLAVTMTYRRGVNKGKRFTYRIREGHSANVDALDSSGCVMIRFCAHPLGRIPVYDGMLAQKLWIETDENMFLKRRRRVRLTDDERPAWSRDRVA